MREFWSKEEDSLLKKYYPESPKEQVLKMLPKRTWRAITTRASQMGVKRIYRCPRPDVVIRNKSYKQREAVREAKKGKPRSSKVRKKISLGVLKAYREGRLKPMKGEKNPRYGRPVSDKHKQIARAQIIRLNKNPGFQRKRIEGIKKSKLLKKVNGERFRRLNNTSIDWNRKRLRALCKRPTKPERYVIELISKYGLPYRYVGDGSVLIGNLNPDFIHSNGEKKIIEVFGRVWHEMLLRKGDYKRTEEGRKKIFSEKGYKTLILWDDELNDANEKNIIRKIAQL